MKLVGLTLGVIGFLMTPAYAHNHENGDAKAEEIKTIEVSNTVTMIQVGGGNIAVFEGDDGLVIVDNGLAEKQENVAAAIQDVSKQPIRFMINTHWHFDHAGNNEFYGDQKTTIMAHENVRKRLKEGGKIEAFDKTLEPATLAALPVLTYDEGPAIHLNGEKIQIQTGDAAHTDGDSVIYWADQNILHTGDIFFNGFFPFIDASSGGSIQGMAQRVNSILSMVDNDTKIIPGHGPLATKKDLQNYYAMLVEVTASIEKAKKNNQSKEDWIKSKPLKTLDEEWGDGFLPLDKFTNIVWNTYK